MTTKSTIALVAASLLLPSAAKAQTQTRDTRPVEIQIFEKAMDMSAEEPCADGSKRVFTGETKKIPVTSSNGQTSFIMIRPSECVKQANKLKDHNR